LRLLDHAHGTVYLSSSLTARHFSPSRYISRLTYLAYLFRERFDCVKRPCSSLGRLRSYNFAKLHYINLHYRVLRTTQPTYLYNLIFVQPSFQYSFFFCLSTPWLQLTNHSLTVIVHPVFGMNFPRFSSASFSRSVTSILMFLLMSFFLIFTYILSTTPSLFHSRLKTYLFNKSFSLLTVFVPPD